MRLHAQRRYKRCQHLIATWLERGGDKVLFVLGMASTSISLTYSAATYMILWLK